MKKNILFIADGSITNPILMSQGLPFLAHTSEFYNVNFLSYENSNPSEEKKNEIEAIKEKYISRVNFLTLYIDKKGLLPEWLNFFFKIIPELTKIVKDKNIKLIHARSFIPAVLALFIKKIVKKDLNFIYDNRGLYIDERIYKGEIKKNSLKEKFFRWLEYKIIKHSDHIVVVSNAFKDYLLKFYDDKNISIPSKITVIPNRTWLNEDWEQIKNAKPDIKKRVVAVYSGSAASWQGTDDIIECFKILVDLIPNFSLVIITYHPSEFEERVKNEDFFSSRIKVIKLQPDQVAKALIKCNFALLLRKSDKISKVSSPIKFGEYLAAGLPVMMYNDIGDFNPILKKYKVGVSIEGGNFTEASSKISKMIKNKEIVNQCLSVATKDFDIRDSFKQYEKIYEQLLLN